MISDRDLLWHCPHCGSCMCDCVACELMFANPKDIPPYLQGRFHPHTCTRVRSDQ